MQAEFPLPSASWHRDFVFVGWIVKPKTIIDEVRISSKFSAAGAWTIMIKYIAPVLVIIILVAYVAAQFGFFSM